MKYSTFTNSFRSNSYSNKKFVLLFIFASFLSVNSFSQTSPGSWSGTRPANPSITNKMSRMYTEADGAILYTACDAPSGALQNGNLDKVVFGPAKINKDGAATQLSTVFKGAGTIYAEVMLRSSLYNYKVYMTDVSNEPTKCMNGTYDVNYLIDGKNMGILISQSPIGARESKSTVSFIIVGGGDDADMNNEDFVKLLSGLSPGPHTIKMIVWATQGDFISVDPVAMGEFTYSK